MVAGDRADLVCHDPLLPALHSSYGQIMNDDRCYHIPTSEGQSVCTCLDRRMWLEMLVELQARRIAELEYERQQNPVKYGIAPP